MYDIGSIVNRKSKALHPVIVQKHSILDSIDRALERLGLKKRQREFTVADWMREAEKNNLSATKSEAT